MMMIQRTSPALKRRKVAAVKDFPPFTAKDEFGGAHVAVIRETKEEDFHGYGDDTKCVAHHRTSPSFKRQKVSAVRDFAHFTVKNETSEIGSDDVAVESDLKNGYEDSKCVGGVARRDYHRPNKEVESFYSIMKKAGFIGNVGNGKFPPAKRKVPLLSENKVKPLSEEEGIRLMASHGNFHKLSKGLQIPRHSPVNKTLSNATASRLRANAVQKHRHSPLAKKKLSNAAVLRPMTNAHKPTQHRHERRSNELGFIPRAIQQNRITKDLSPREKVLKVLRIFKLVHDEFDRDKVPRRGESKTAASRAHLRTRKVLMERGMQLNEEKMIGPVPGIEVGDEYQFKAELNIIGLHFNMRGGIDYMEDGNMKVATSIVSSEGSGYTDSCGSDVMFYCGEGGHKVIKDQKLVAGNLALANSMERKTPVRVILGKERSDHRGKDYVYDGLYMVDKYWTEKGPHGNIMYKFELSRIAGQPSCDLFKRLV
ncbi:PREDICTED: YDG domain-containing protein At5g47160-like [Camelina sativa]|uniref:YDG domain-containing protein At5g47160-like n=1 Tax=Camelina sativa TaxID=90675 RepID=A0ABM1QMG3_CAMSA|nr:PREDICTED: YDG domain-containing protein At5g47160-like [Camelina sativa]